MATFAELTPVERHTIAVAARKLAQATEPAYSGLVADGATNNYDAESDVQAMIAALQPLIGDGGMMPANVVVYDGDPVVDGTA